MAAVRFDQLAVVAVSDGYLDTMKAGILIILSCISTRDLTFIKGSHSGGAPLKCLNGNRTEISVVYEQRWRGNELCLVNSVNSPDTCCLVNKQCIREITAYSQHPRELSVSEEEDMI